MRHRHLTCLVLDYTINLSLILYCCLSDASMPLKIMRHLKMTDTETYPEFYIGETTWHGSVSISEGQSRAFLDCWFTLAALEADPELQKHMRNVIRKAGGRIFDAGRLNLVTNTSGAYAVCPFGFPAQARREALRHPDFKKGELHKPTSALGLGDMSDGVLQPKL